MAGGSQPLKNHQSLCAASCFHVQPSLRDRTPKNKTSQKSDNGKGSQPTSLVGGFNPSANMLVKLDHLSKDRGLKIPKQNLWCFNRNHHPDLLRNFFGAQKLRWWECNILQWQRSLRSNAAPWPWAWQLSCRRGRGAALRGGVRCRRLTNMTTAWAQEVDVFYTKKLRWQLQRSLKAKIIYVCIYIYNMNHHDRSLQNSMRFM